MADGQSDPLTYRSRMRPGLLVLALVTAACGASPREGANVPTAAPSSEVAVSPPGLPSAELAASPAPTSAPSASVESPRVQFSATPFPLVASSLRVAPIDDEAGAVAGTGLLNYLESLDRFRETGATDRTQLYLEGRFGDAVFAGLRASATPAKRKFALGSFKVDRLLVKPWGVRAVVEVTATIERYETFNEIRDGVATVRLNGTVVTTDSSGRTARAPFERRAVVLIGNWMPEVVDEQITGATWLSGGDLALGVRDHNFA